MYIDLYIYVYHVEQNQYVGKKVTHIYNADEQSGYLITISMTTTLLTQTFSRCCVTMGRRSWLGI